MHVQILTDVAVCSALKIADEDESAYAALQASWKDESMTAEDKVRVAMTWRGTHWGCGR